MAARIVRAEIYFPDGRTHVINEPLWAGTVPAPSPGAPFPGPIAAVDERVATGRIVRWLGFPHSLEIEETAIQPPPRGLVLPNS